MIPDVVVVIAPSQPTLNEKNANRKFFVFIPVFIALYKEDICAHAAADHWGPNPEVN